MEKESKSTFSFKRAMNENNSTFANQNIHNQNGKKSYYQNYSRPSQLLYEKKETKKTINYTNSTSRNFSKKSEAETKKALWSSSIKDILKSEPIKAQPPSINKPKSNVQNNNPAKLNDITTNQTQTKTEKPKFTFLSSSNKTMNEISNQSINGNQIKYSAVNVSTSPFQNTISKELSYSTIIERSPIVNHSRSPSPIPQNFHRRYKRKNGIFSTLSVFLFLIFLYIIVMFISRI